MTPNAKSERGRLARQAILIARTTIGVDGQDIRAPLAAAWRV